MGQSGIINKVTSRRYEAIKRHVENYDCGAVDDKAVGETFGVSVTTMRKIRNTRNYDEYLELSKRYHRNRTSQKPRDDQSIVLPKCYSANTGCNCNPDASLMITVIAASNVVIAIALTYMALHGL